MPENKLERHFLMPPEHPVFGSLQVFGEIKRSVEKWQNMYIKLLPEELECAICGERDFRNCNCDNEGILPYEGGEVQGKGLVWDDFMFAGKSKIFGYYTNLQMTKKQVTNVNESGKLLLLQIGENFNNEGLFIVFINKEDLARCDFSKCKLEWSQS